MTTVKLGTRLVICEGYQDRAFWAGWLGLLNCEDLKPTTGRPTVQVIRKGEFTFRGKSGALIRIIPSQLHGGVWNVARELIRDWRTREFDRVVIAIDADVDAAASEHAPTGFRQKDLLTWVKLIDHAAIANSDGDVSLGETGPIVSLVRWECGWPRRRCARQADIGAAGLRCDL